MGTMFQRNWSDPVPLQAWQTVPTGPGLYIIGCAYDLRLPIGTARDSEGMIGGFAVNFVPLYIGQSLSAGRGLRGRLSAHARRHGNRYIASAVSREMSLWSIFVAGRDMAEYETIYLDLPNGIYFPFNIRSEVNRALYRMAPALEAEGLVPLDPFALQLQSLDSRWTADRRPAAWIAQE